MARLCERPGCSAPAACVYGIDSRRLVVWIDGTVPEDAGSATLGKRAGVLCRRHADSMVVPIGWSLDDRRDAEADARHAPVRIAATSRSSRRERRRGADADGEQLALLDVPADTGRRSRVADEPTNPPETSPEVDPEPVAVSLPDDGPAPEVEVDIEPEFAPGVRGGVDVVGDGGASPALGDAPSPDAPPPAAPWRPVFDQTDDLGGLLATRSPLLARAFGKRDAPPREPASDA